MEIGINKGLLCGEDLINLNSKKVDPNLLLRGLKKKVKESTVEEEENVKLFQDNLKQLISQERIDKACNRSQGIWELDSNCVRILRMEGNWNIHGFVENFELLIEPHEALHLMEMNRLEIYYNSVIMSLEQAYSIFLRRENSLNLEQYSVYSRLMRAGYILFKHREIEFIKDSKAEKDNFVWKIFLESLNLVKKQTLNNENCNKSYLYMKNSMEIIKNRIRNCQSSDSHSNEIEEVCFWNINKKNTSNKKKRKFEFVSRKTKEKFNSFLRVEEDFLEFKKMFDQIKIIHLKKIVEEDETQFDNRKFNYDFDLYLPNSSFKKSERGNPNYRIIILRSSDSPLSGLDVMQLYEQQLTQIPILVIIVSELMNFQAFLYNISTE